MNTKLTLKLNKEIIEKAKLYAKEKQTSLSGLVENYFKHLAKEQENGESDLSPIVEELSGIIEIPEKFDPEEEYTNYLIEKY